MNAFSVTGLFFVAFPCAVLAVLTLVKKRRMVHLIWTLFLLSVVVWGIGMFKIGGSKTEIESLYSLLKDEANATHHAIKLIYIGTISDEETAELADDVSETKWFTPEEIELMDLKTLRDLDIKQMTKNYFSGKKYPLNLLTHTIQK